jgi:hypothetical protein
VSTLRHGRVAENEAFFRDVNEHALERRDQFLRRLPPDEPVRFMCECASGECELTLQLTLAEYSHVREHADWFIVIPGHETADIEDIVERRGRFYAVEKHADASA